MLAVPFHQLLKLTSMTITCKVTSAQYLAQLGRMYLRDRWPWLVAPLLLCAALSVCLGDVRWAVVGLMMLFIVIPMVLAMAYVNYALSAEARWSLMDKQLTVKDDGIAMHFDDERMHDHFVSWSEVAAVKVGGESFLLMLQVRRYTFVMIPFSAIEQAGISLRDFAQQLYR